MPQKYKGGRGKISISSSLFSPRKKLGRVQDLSFQLNMTSSRDIYRNQKGVMYEIRRNWPQIIR